MSGHYFATVPLHVMDTFLRPAPWIHSPRSIAVRLFLTCWLVYSIHVATNTVREIYLALAIGDHFSFRVDEYAHMHPDLFEKPGYGLAYRRQSRALRCWAPSLMPPAVRWWTAWWRRSIAAAPASRKPPAYNSPWPHGPQVLRGILAARLRCEIRPGSDHHAGLLHGADFGADGGGDVLSAAARLRVRPHWPLDGAAVCVRHAGFLPHRLSESQSDAGPVRFYGLSGDVEPRRKQAHFRKPPLSAGGTGRRNGAAHGLLGRGVSARPVPVRHCQGRGVWRPFGRTVRLSSWYVAGSLARCCCCGSISGAASEIAFLPGQNWMPPVEWIDNGYQGFTLPQMDLLAICCSITATGCLSPVRCCCWRCSRRYGIAAERRAIAGREFAVLAGSAACPAAVLRRHQLHAAAIQHRPALPGAAAAVPVRAGRDGAAPSAAAARGTSSRSQP